MTYLLDDDLFSMQFSRFFLKSRLQHSDELFYTNLGADFCFFDSISRLLAGLVRVEVSGLEPLTSCVQGRRSTS